MKRFSMMTAAVLLASVVALSGCERSSAAASLKVGSAAPDITAEALLQAPDTASVTWESLRGKVVVLEFWATWCPPCVESMPHLSALAEEFKGRDVQFIGITPEEREPVETFITQNKVPFWIVLNPGSQTFERYGVDTIPRTVLVDKQGIVRSVMYPTELTAEKIEALLE